MSGAHSSSQTHRPEYGKYQVALRFPERIETDFRMLFDVAASLVVHQQVEHRAVRHVMAVNQQVRGFLREGISSSLSGSKLDIKSGRDRPDRSAAQLMHAVGRIISPPRLPLSQPPAPFRLYRLRGVFSFILFKVNDHVALPATTGNA